MSGFREFLRGVKAAAWQEGYLAGFTDTLEDQDGKSLPATPNPYEEER